jgi:acyl-CoA dehydrogenase
MPIDFAIDPDFQQKLDWARAFVRERVIPLEVVEDIDDYRFMQVIRRLQAEVKREGLWAVYLPQELGGAGLGQVKNALVNEILGTSYWAPLVFGNQAPDSGNAEILAMFGSPELKERWLYPLLDGRMRTAFSMTEPEHAGSDPTRMSTTARLEDGHWVISGHKWFTSNAMIADFLIVMVVTDPDAPPYQRASMILVPTGTSGVELVRNVETMSSGDSRFGYGHTEVLYKDVRVPEGNMIGKPGEGFTIAQKRLGPGRIHHCMRWLGQAQRAFDMLCERSLQREAHGGLLATKQTVQNWIADSAAEIQAARLLTLHAAWKIDAEGASAARREIATIKFFGAKVLHDVIDRAIQVHGALGFSADLPLESMYRAARAARIYDGPDEVHRQTLARLILKGYQPAPGIWPREHIPSRRAAAHEAFAQLLEEATANL